MSTHTFDAGEIELRRKLLREELAILEADKLKSLGAMQVVDYHHPERSPGWPIYRHQPFPQMLYHPTQKDPRIEETRLGIRRRNEINPNLAPMDIPPSEPLTRNVANEAEKKQALAEGWDEKAPNRQSIDANSPLHLIGRGPENPLIEPRAQTSAFSMSVETILKLNALPKDELLKQARELYGVEVSDEASKVQILTLIQEGVHHAANAS